MGMVFCRGCGKEIHETAPVCPHCGAPQLFSGGIKKTDESVQQQIVELTSKGYIVLNQNDTSAQLKKTKKFSIGWAFFWTVITWGPGFFLYLGYFWLIKKDEFKYITIATPKSLIEDPRVFSEKPSVEVPRVAPENQVADVEKASTESHPAAAQRMITETRSFLDVVGRNLSDDTIYSRFENSKFIKFVDDFSSKFSKKQWSWLGFQWTLGLNVLFTLLFGKPRFGYEIFHRQQIDASYFFKRYEEFAKFDIDKEVPLLGGEEFILTNKFFYFNASKSKKIKDMISAIGKRSTGKIELKKIKTISSKRGLITDNTIEISMNNEIVCAISFLCPSDAEIMEKFLSELNQSLSQVL